MTFYFELKKKIFFWFSVLLSPSTTMLKHFKTKFENSVSADKRQFFFSDSKISATGGTSFRYSFINAY